MALAAIAAVKKNIAKVKTKFRVWRSKDFHCIFLCQTLLFHLGVWFEEEGATGVGVAVRSLMRGLVQRETGYALFVGHPMLAYHTVGKDLHQTTEEVASVFYASLVIVQIRSLCCGRERLERLFRALVEMQRCAELLPYKSRSILGQARRWSERVLIYTVACAGGLLVSFTSVPQLIAARSFMYRLWYPFDEQNSPYFEILFVLVFINHSVAFLTMVFVNTLFMELLVQAVGHFRLLRCNLRNVFKKQSPPVRVVHRERTICEDDLQMRRETEGSDTLRICARHHNAVLDFIHEINTTFNEILLLQLLGTLVPTGLGVILIIHADNIERTITYITMSSAGIVGTGLFCWLADKVTDESELVRDAVFGCAWLSASAGFKRSMRIIMSRANQPVVIRVAGFIALSVETFYSVMKLTYSYFMASWTYFNKSVQR